MENIDYTSGIKNEIVCFGDSLTNGTGAISPLLNMPTYLINILNKRLVINYGIGGQNSEQIACRQGGMPIYITVTGNSISGTADTAITSISTQFLSTSADTTTRYSSGMINGSPALIIRTVVSTVETYVIRGLGTVAIQANSIFVPDTAYNAFPNIQVLWWGKNGSGSSDLLTLYNQAVAVMESPRRVIIIGVSLSLNQIIGTAGYTSITNYNATIKAAYPNNYVETTPPTTAEMDAIKYTPTTQDNIDIANGVFPGGMYFDNVHFNGYGYNIFANRVASMIKQYGW